MSKQILQFDENDIAEVLRYEELIPLMRETLIAFSHGEAIQPVRQMLPVEPDQRYLGIMPAATTTAMGAKLVCFYPKNATVGKHTHTASIALFDPEDGQPLAFLDGRLITEMRTAATSAAVAQTLAPAGSTSLAIIGAGVQGAAHLSALSTLFDFDDIRVWNRTPGRAEEFAERWNAKATDCESAVRGADIVVTATSSRSPIVEGKWLKPGSLLCSVGSPRPDWRELDDDVMTNTVVVDSLEAVNKESGDVILSGATVLGEAGQVLSGALAVNETDTKVFKSVGIAVEDLATARMVYDRRAGD